MQTLKQCEPLDTIFYIILIDPSERKASENEMNLRDCRARQPAYRVHGYGFISVPPSFIQFLSLFLVLPGPWASGSPSCWPPEPHSANSRPYIDNCSLALCGTSNGAILCCFARRRRLPWVPFDEKCQQTADSESAEVSAIISCV